jgi:hypothetical protein
MGLGAFGIFAAIAVAFVVYAVLTIAAVSRAAGGAK